MAIKRRIQHIRGTTAQNNAFTGRSGELSVDTEKNELRVHDGFTVGGHRVYTQSEVDTLLASKSTQADIDTSITALLSVLYPVGSVYIGTQNACPMAILITGSTWELVPSGKALWIGDGTTGNGSSVTTTSTGATNTIQAGVPNITSNMGCIAATTTYLSGAVYLNGATERHGRSGNDLSYAGYSFDASRSSAVYGNSTTVQPPAYVVNVWRRTA